MYACESTRAWTSIRSITLLPDEARPIVCPDLPMINSNKAKIELSHQGRCQLHCLQHGPLSLIGRATIVNTCTAPLDNLSLGITRLDTPTPPPLQCIRKSFERRKSCLYLVGVIESDVKNIRSIHTSASTVHRKSMTPRQCCA